MLQSTKQWVTYFQAHLAEKKKLNDQIYDLRNIAIQTRSFVVQRGGKVAIDLLFARKKVLRYLPLPEINSHVDTIFESQETQRLILEQVVKILMVKGISEPTENDLCATAMDVCFSEYLRAHMYYGEHLDV